MDVHGDGYKGCSRCLVIKFKSACFLTPMTADIKFQNEIRINCYRMRITQRSITIFDYDKKISIRLDGPASLGG